MKGQMTIIGVMMGFVALVVYAAFLPAINDVIDDILPEVDAMTGLVVRLIPFVLVIAIIGSIILYMRPQTQYVPG